MDGDRRVIAGVSGSLRSLGALRAGVAQAREAGAPLLAVLAWVPVGGEYAYRRAPCPLLLRVWEQAARQRLDDAFDDAFGGLPAGVTVQPVVLRGKPGPVLVTLADQAGDLLIVGAGRHGGPGLFRSGAVSRYCLAHARCPVLAVPPPDLITAVRSRPHRWRAEDFAPGGAGSRSDGEPGGPGAVTLTRRAPARQAPARRAQARRLEDPQLPCAYRGAPYYQPRRPSWGRRMLRRLRLLGLLGVAIVVIVMTGLLLAQGNP